MTALAAALVVFATARGVYATPDAGLHVRKISPPLARETFVDDLAVRGPSRIWFVAWDASTVRARVYRSTNGGRTWASFDAPSHNAHGGARDSLSFVDARNGWLTVQEPTAPFATLFTTHDGGATWKRVAGLPEVAPAHFQDARHGYLAGSAWAGGLYWTADGGRHWRKLVVPSLSVGRPVFGTPQFLGRTTFEPVTYRRSFSVAFTTPSGSFRLSAPLAVARPSTFTCYADPMPLAVVDRTTWWTASGRFVYRSRDAGRTWTSLPAPHPQGPCVTPSLRAVGSVLILGEGPDTFVSRGGAHWQHVR